MAFEDADESRDVCGSRDMDSPRLPDGLIDKALIRQQDGFTAFRQWEMPQCVGIPTPLTSASHEASIALHPTLQHPASHTSTPRIFDTETQQKRARDTLIIRGSWIEIGKQTCEVASAHNGQRRNRWWSRLRPQTATSEDTGEQQQITQDSLNRRKWGGTDLCSSHDHVRKGQRPESIIQRPWQPCATFDAQLQTKPKAVRQPKKSLTAFASLPQSFRRKKQQSTDDITVGPWLSTSGTAALTDYADQSYAPATQWPPKHINQQQWQDRPCAPCDPSHRGTQPLFKPNSSSYSLQERSVGFSPALQTTWKPATGSKELARRPSGELELLLSTPSRGKELLNSIRSPTKSPLRRNNSMPLLTVPAVERNSAQSSRPNEDATQRTVGSSILYADEQLLASRSSQGSMEPANGRPVSGHHILRNINKPLPPVAQPGESLLTPNRATADLSQLIKSYRSGSTAKLSSLGEEMTQRSKLSSPKDKFSALQAVKKQKNPPAESNTTLETIMTYKSSSSSWTSGTVSEMLVSSYDETLGGHVPLGNDATRERDSNLQLLIDGVMLPDTAVPSKLNSYCCRRDAGSVSDGSSEGSAFSSFHWPPQPPPKAKQSGASAISQDASRGAPMSILGANLMSKHISIRTQDSPCPSPKTVGNTSMSLHKDAALHQERHVSDLDLTKIDVRARNLFVGQVLLPQSYFAQLTPRKKASVAGQSKQVRQKDASKVRQDSRSRIHSRKASSVRVRPSCSPSRVSPVREKSVPRPLSESTVASSQRDSLQGECVVIKQADVVRKSTASFLDLHEVAGSLAHARERSGAYAKGHNKVDTPNGTVHLGDPFVQGAYGEFSFIGGCLNDSPGTPASLSSAQQPSEGDISFAWSDLKRNSFGTTCTLPSPGPALMKASGTATSHSAQFKDREARLATPNALSVSDVMPRLDHSNHAAVSSKEIIAKEIRHSREHYTDTSYTRLIMSSASRREIGSW